MEESFYPWLEIWTRPRSTIRRIISGENPRQSFWALATIYGLGSLLNNAQALSLGSFYSLFSIFLLSILLAPLWGYIFFSFWSFVVFGIGKLFKGAGTFQQVRTAYAWSIVPFSVNIALWVLLAVFFGQNLFISQFAIEPISNYLIFILFFTLITRIVLAIWSLVIYFNALAEVQNYSILKAILNVVTAGLLVFAGTWAIWSLSMHLWNRG